MEIFAGFTLDLSSFCFSITLIKKVGFKGNAGICNHSGPWEKSGASPRQEALNIEHSVKSRRGQDPNDK